MDPDSPSDYKAILDLAGVGCSGGVGPGARVERADVRALRP
jgi:hypothetical protein